MVHQRTPIRPRIYSGFSHNSNVVDDDSSNCIESNQPIQHPQQPQRRRLVTITFRQLFHRIGLKIGFIFLVYLAISKKTSIVVLPVHPSSTNDNNGHNNNDNNVVEARMMRTSTKKIDDLTLVEGSNEDLSLSDIAIAGLDSPLPSIFSYESITSVASENNSSLAGNDPCYRMKNEADIRWCYVSQGVKKFSDQRCHSIQNWTDVQHCLMRRYHYPYLKHGRQINEVHVLGERNSGTKFVTEFLQRCYPKSSRIKVHRDFIRSKHFFQPIYNQMDFSKRLIVVVVRDPIEWMAAMREFPYHSPDHLAGFQNGQPLPLPWYEFVNKTWTTDASRADRQLMPENRKKTVCTMGFRFDEVKPCILREEMVTGPPWNIPPQRMRGYYPLYEQRRGSHTTIYCNCDRIR